MNNRRNPLLSVATMLVAALGMAQATHAAQYVVTRTWTTGATPPASPWRVNVMKYVTPMNSAPVEPDWWDGWAPIYQPLVYTAPSQPIGGTGMYIHTYKYEINNLLPGSYRVDVYHLSGGNWVWQNLHDFTVP